MVRIVLTCFALAITLTPGVSFANVKKCDQSLRDEMVAPLEAKIIRSATMKMKDGGATIFICYQARTRGGGYGTAGGTCDFDKSGSLKKADLSGEAPMSGLYCDMAKALSK